MVRVTFELSTDVIQKQTENGREQVLFNKTRAIIWIFYPKVSGLSVSEISDRKTDNQIIFYVGNVLGLHLF